MKEISFIHAADLHLDSPFKGMSSAPESIFKEIRHSTFTALDNLVSEAIKRQVDFVLIVGDLFDNETQSLKAQIRLRYAFEQLENKKINVYLSYGNHDHLKGNIYPITYPDNVFIFPDEEVSEFIYEREGTPLAAIYGFSYENRAVTANKSLEYKITNTDVRFNIATLHGSIQNNLEHDTYAPFVLTDLTKQPFDYWALGHIHKPSILKEAPYIVYSGNTQGRHRLEVGEKGCYHVTISESETKLTFIPLQAIKIKQLTVDVSTCKEVHKLESIINQKLSAQPVTNSELIEVILTGTSDDLSKWESEGLIDDVIELINERSTYSQHWQYIFSYSVMIERSLLNKGIQEGDHFIGELLRGFEEAPIQDYVQDIYNHQQGRKYLTAIDDKKITEIKAQAKQLLINKLLS